MIEGMELPTQEKIQTFGEKNTYKYLEILEAATVKQAELKEKKLKKGITEQKNSSKQNYLAGISSKG